MLRILLALTIAGVLLGTVMGSAAFLEVNGGHLGVFTFPAPDFPDAECEEEGEGGEEDEDEECEDE